MDYSSHWLHFEKGHRVVVQWKQRKMQVQKKMQ